MKKFVGIIVGTIVSFAIGFPLGFLFERIVTSAGVGSELTRYSPVFIGGLIAGSICKEKRWLYGGAVGLLWVIILGVILKSIAYQLSWGQMLFAPEIRLLIPAVLTVLAGSFGGFVSQLLKRSRAV